MKKKIDITNFDKLIPEKIAYIILRSLLYIFALIFLTKYYKIGACILLLYDIISFIRYFRIYTTFYILKKQDEAKKSHRKSTIEVKYDIDSYAKLLGISLDDDEVTIKRRYRELSKMWHPDKWVNECKENQAIANRNFQKLNNAYDIIKKYKNMK